MRIIFEKSIEVFRLKSDTEKMTEEYEKSGDIKGVIMPIKAEDLILNEGNPAKMFKLYASYDVDLKEADKVKCGEVEYIVKSITRLDFRSLSRTEAFIYKPNN
jgi:hypothetical protein